MQRRLSASHPSSRHKTATSSTAFGIPYVFATYVLGLHDFYAGEVKMPSETAVTIPFP